MPNNLEAALNLKSVAIVGASDNALMRFGRDAGRTPPVATSLAEGGKSAVNDTGEV